MPVSYIYIIYVCIYIYMHIQATCLYDAKIGIWERRQKNIYIMVLYILYSIICLYIVYIYQCLDIKRHL